MNDSNFNVFFGSQSSGPPDKWDVLISRLALFVVKAALVLGIIAGILVIIF